MVGEQTVHGAKVRITNCLRNMGERRGIIQCTGTVQWYTHQQLRHCHTEKSLVVDHHCRLLVAQELKLQLPTSVTQDLYIGYMSKPFTVTDKF